MDKRVRLVFVPGSPISLEALCPKSHLLILQSRLAAEAIASDIVDFGTLEDMNACRPDEPERNVEMRSGWASQTKPGWGGFPVLHRITRTRDIQPIDSEVDTKLSRLREGSPSILLFWIENRDMYRRFKEYSLCLRASLYETKIVLAGPYAIHYGTYALSDCSCLDAVITGDLTDSILALLHNEDGDTQWQEVPGLLLRNTEGVVCRSEFRSMPRVPTSLNLGAFQHREPGTQFPLFHLTFNWSPAPFYYQDSYRQPYDCKSPGAVVGEMNHLQRNSNARTFHIAAPCITANTLADFADMLLKQNLAAIYSLGDVTESLGKSLSERLFASGCRSIGFRIPTGSQRMLEDFYGCHSSISAMRASLRHCREAGIYTVVRMCYPCPADDYHTRAEIELFIEAVKPNAVCIEPPALAPDSLWFRRASEFGFFISHREYARHAVGGNSVYGAFPYTMRGWNARRIFQAQASLSAAVVKLGCRINITEQLGLLARLARSTMEESLFLDALLEALSLPDTTQLQKLVACLDTNAHSLSSGHIQDTLVGKAVSFS